MTVNWEKALKIAKATLLAGVLFGSIGFVEKQYSSRSCKAIKGGSLMVEIDQRRPIAQMVSDFDKKGNIKIPYTG
jgi:hypothetical protein